MDEQGRRDRLVLLGAALACALWGAIWGLGVQSEQAWGWDESMHAELPAVHMLLAVQDGDWTGAARVAVGPDLAPYFTDDDDLAGRLDQSAREVADPVWRLPFHAPYEAMIEPGIADLDNAPKGGFAGAITAALFLRRFAGEGRYIHFDRYGWTPTVAPARPKGGVGMGARALLATLPGALKL